MAADVSLIEKEIRKALEAIECIQRKVKEEDTQKFKIPKKNREAEGFCGK